METLLRVLILTVLAAAPASAEVVKLEDRYGTLENYVAIVTRAADQAVRDRFLLPGDAARIVHEAQTSNILPHAAAAATPATSCEPLASLTLQNAVVTVARAYPAGEVGAPPPVRGSVDDAANFSCVAR